MKLFLFAFISAMVFSSLGFKKYVWFISLGYGFSITAIGIMLLIMGANVPMSLLFVIYGIRLGGYLAFREIKSSAYNTKMQGEIHSGEGMKLSSKVSIWLTSALMYACQTAPLAFRTENQKGSAVMLNIGIVVSLCGLLIEALADFQKNEAKKKNPARFVDTGLYKIVRCPNYFGEMLFWTGTFVGGITAYSGVLQWVIALLGYLGIIYVMFGGARRLEMRQNRTYGEDPEYQNYVKTTPIMIPLVPLYSVEKYTWLVG
ncbi:MAG: DUF1295 domain-containing protein [Oscillospiraceae bacterium]|nr:DUF1295 domain-containing protein [Oscillospiraceae bacterium]